MTGVVNLLSQSQGTFTPAITFGGAAVGITYGAQVGSYTKIGNAVTFSLFVSMTSKGSSTGSMVITNLPFTSNATTNNSSAVSIRVGGGGLGATINGALQVMINANASVVGVAKIIAGASTSVSDADVTDTSNFTISGTYFT